jgi:hypothetical protein
MPDKPGKFYRIFMLYGGFKTLNVKNEIFILARNDIKDEFFIKTKTNDKTKSKRNLKTKNKLKN